MLGESGETVHAWHRQVEQHDVRLQLDGRGDRAGAILGLADDVEALLRQKRREGVARQRVVVDDEDAIGHLPLIGRSARCRQVERGPRSVPDISVVAPRRDPARLPARVRDGALRGERLAEVRVRAPRRAARVRYRRGSRRDVRLRAHERSLHGRRANARPPARSRFLEHRPRNRCVRPRSRLRRRLARPDRSVAAGRCAPSRSRSHRDRALRGRADGGASSLARLSGSRRRGRCWPWQQVR